MTLLEHRRNCLVVELDFLGLEIRQLERAALRQTKASEMVRILAALADRAANAHTYARMVEDLEDVEKYGPEGGR